MAGLLLDTCAVIWLANKDPMRPSALAEIAAARSEGAIIAISPMAAWEIAIKVAKRRLFLAMSPDAYFQRVIDAPGVALALLTPQVLIASCFLPGSPPADPADRIMAATAREFGYAVVTRDRALLDYAGEGYINAVEC